MSAALVVDGFRGLGLALDRGLSNLGPALTFRTERFETTKLRTPNPKSYATLIRRILKP